MNMTIARNNKICLRQITSSEIPYVIRLEQDVENAEFVGQWDEAQHEAALQNADCGHWMIETTVGSRVVGYAILRGLKNPYHSVELMRLVIAEKSQGYGRATLRLIEQVAFEQFHAHRLWLDVREKNLRAITLYQSEGFVVEGTLRECQKFGNEYSNLVLMSRLEHEWRAGQ
ncbi:GCN5-related N-acetyltransferase [Candidatus Moduliflexus flocculans]|uniref:GCN5-related N-acetyltransferase n=1 Tax=Candidatus Moduliflexus flocculans TaxID=1499966 RepID=A0A0S6VRX1_9BACT|nr:GCN5-related N-acetyltransferase [Candidatus Moduliflexus flocculans]